MRLKKFLLRSSINVQNLALDLTILESVRRKHIFCILLSGFTNIASVTKPNLKSSYTGHTIKTCFSSSTHEAQWKQTRWLRSKFWYRPVSTLIRAVPDLNLSPDYTIEQVVSSLLYETFCFIFLSGLHGTT